MEQSPEKEEDAVAKVRFQHQIVTYDVGGRAVLAARAYDSAGRRLKLDRFGNRDSQDGSVNYFWGEPAKLELVISHRRFEKLIPFEIVRNAADKQAVTVFKQEVATRRKVVKTLLELHALRDQLDGYDDLAGLYYLNDKAGQMRKRSSVDVARACPLGAERTGYKAQPYEGYFFGYVPAKQVEDKTEPYQRDKSKKRAYAWARGELEVYPLTELPALVAWPKDPSMPTYVASEIFEQVYMKKLDGETVKALSALPSGDGWSRVEFLQTPEE